MTTNNSYHWRDLKMNEAPPDILDQLEAQIAVRRKALAKIREEEEHKISATRSLIGMCVESVRIAEVKSQVYDAGDLISLVLIDTDGRAVNVDARLVNANDGEPVAKLYHHVVL